MAVTQPFHSSNRRSPFIAYLLLRALQLGATTITGQIYCYLIWQHNFHFCHWRRGCSAKEREELKVPWVYIIFVTLLTATFISIFVSSYRYISAFIDDLTGFPRYSAQFEDPTPAPEKLPINFAAPEAQPSPEVPASEDTEDGPHGSIAAIKDLFAALGEAYRGEHQVFNAQMEPLLTARARITSHAKQIRSTICWAYQSPHQAALLLDVIILELFTLNFVYYTYSYIWGPVIPYCPVIPSIEGPGYLPSKEAFWMKLKVLDKECILSQVGWGSAVAVIVFSTLIVGLEAYLVRGEMCEEKERIKGQGSEKARLVPK